MKLLTQPNSWSCLPTSFAMVAGTSFEEIASFIKHDGSQIVRKCVGDPYCRRSFGLNELIAYMVMGPGFNVTPIIPEFDYQASQTILSEPYKCNLPAYVLGEMLLDYDGIIIGDMRHSGRGHAVAWCHSTQTVYDPAGRTYTLLELGLEVESFLLCTRLNKHRSFSGL